MAKVAVLLADGFDDSQFRLPYDRLQEAGHDVLILGHQRGECVRDRRSSDETWIEGYSTDTFPASDAPRDVGMTRDAARFLVARSLLRFW